MFFVEIKVTNKFGVVDNKFELFFSLDEIKNTSK